MMEQYEAAAHEQADKFDASIKNEMTFSANTIAKYCGFELTQTELLRFVSYRKLDELSATCDVVLLYNLLDEEKQKLIHDKFMWDMRLEDGQL